jgi:hypothetical protein
MSCAACCRHLIVSLPGLAFADACHAGRFVRCVLLRLLATGVHSSDHANFLVRNKDGVLTSWIDMGVYTRNRCARAASGAVKSQAFGLWPVLASRR